MFPKATEPEVAILQVRGAGSRVVSLPFVLLFVVFCAVQVVLEPTAAVPQLVCIFSFGVLTLILAELLYRITLVGEELRHLETRYHGNVFNLLSKTCGVEYPKLLLSISVAMVFTVLGLWSGHSDVLQQYLATHKISLVTQLFLNSLVLAFLGLRGPTATELSDLTEKNLLNVAHGLAWSYYYGYLKLVLPGMRERIAASDWSKDPAECVSVPKLFILLPESCYAFPNLSEADQNVQHVAQAEEFTANRAGNIRRSYRNNIYALRTPEGKKQYCVVEYATPLLSLYEMSQSSEAGLNREEKVRQMQLFYTTLDHIIRNNPQCAQNCVLVPFKDTNADGSKRLISEVLLHKIEEELNTKAQSCTM